MRTGYQERTIHLLVDPNQLRRLAAAMERSWPCEIGSTIWSEEIASLDDGTRIRLVLDQDFFHRKDRGLPDWEEMTPGPAALSAFEKVRGKHDFPETYSGSAWQAAYRLWVAVKDTPEVLDGKTGFEDIAGVKVDDLGLSGFQWGWALNAVRQMLGKNPGPNPAIVTIGAGDHEPAYPSVGPPEQSMRRALGGGE